MSTPLQQCSFLTWKTTFDWQTLGVLPQYFHTHAIFPTPLISFLPDSLLPSPYHNLQYVAGCIPGSCMFQISYNSPGSKTVKNHTSKRLLFWKASHQIHKKKCNTTFNTYQFAYGKNWSSEDTLAIVLHALPEHLEPIHMTAFWWLQFSFQHDPPEQTDNQTAQPWTWHYTL